MWLAVSLMALAAFKILIRWQLNGQQSLICIVTVPDKGYVPNTVQVRSTHIYVGFQAETGQLSDLQLINIFFVSKYGDLYFHSLLQMRMAVEIWEKKNWRILKACQDPEALIYIQIYKIGLPNKKLVQNLESHGFAEVR